MSKDQVFADHPTLESYHETSDGVKFFKNSDAHTYARTLKDKTVIEVKNTSSGEVADKPVAKSENKGKTKKAKTASNKPAGGLDDLTPMQKAKLRIEAIEALDSVEAIKEALKDETAKSVIKAGNERMEALELAVEKTSEGTGEVGAAVNASADGTETETASEEEE